MDLNSLRFWQWMIIGLLAGAAVGLAWSNLPDDLAGRSLDERQFRILIRRPAANGQPAPIKNIVVRAPEIDPSKVLVYPVTFDYLPLRTPGERWREALSGVKPPATPPTPKYISSGIYANTPFDGKQSIIDFLKAQKVSFSNRTGVLEYVPVYYGAAAGFVVIGCVWPAIILGLVSAGLATPRPKAEKKPTAKHRTGADVDDMLLKPVAKPVDAGALDKLNDAMEASLGATLTSGGPREAAPSVEEPVSILMSGTGARSTSDPTEAPAVPMTAEEKKDFAGQYYPVARTTKKDEDSSPTEN